MNWGKRAVLFLVVAACVAIALLPIASAPGNSGIPSGGPAFGDVDLYRHILARTGAEGYYHAAISELAKHGFPLSPFVVVRTPILAWLGDVSWLPLPMLALVSLLFCALPGLRSVERVVLVPVIFASGWHAFMPDSHLIHDYWAGLLLALSFAIYRPGLWWPSVAAALCAAMLREIAVPFLLLSLAFALFERRRAEAIGWLCALAIWAAFMGWHALQVGDQPSGEAQSWFALIGPTQVLQWAAEQTPLRMVPGALGMVLAALAMFGWLGLSTRHGLFAFLYLAGMTFGLSIGAKYNNLFWIMLCLPMWLGGLVFLPRLVGEIVGWPKRAEAEGAQQPTG